MRQSISLSCSVVIWCWCFDDLCVVVNHDLRRILAAVACRRLPLLITTMIWMPCCCQLTVMSYVRSCRAHEQLALILLKLLKRVSVSAPESLDNNWSTSTSSRCWCGHTRQILPSLWRTVSISIITTGRETDRWRFIGSRGLCMVAPLLCACYIHTICNNYCCSVSSPGLGCGLLATVAKHSCSFTACAAVVVKELSTRPRSQVGILIIRSSLVLLPLFHHSLLLDYWMLLGNTYRR